MRPKSEEKEKQIFAATLALVETHGLAGLSMEAVARKARIATGTVYIYFKSKEELLNQLYIATKQQLGRVVFSDCTDETPVKICFQRMCHAYLDYMFKNQAAVLFVHQFLNSPYVLDTAREVGEESAAPFLNLIERGKQDLLLKPLDAKLMLSAIHGLLSECAAVIKSKPRNRHKQLYETAATLCWDAVKA